MAYQGHVRALVDELRSGTIDRRTFLARASAVGLGTASAFFLANAHISASNGYRNGFALYPGQDGSPAASPVAGVSGRPAENTENQQRGAGGELKLIQWQAPTIMSPHVSSGTKDFLAGCMVLEPLIHYLPDASMVPNLVTEVPSVETGSLAEDLSEVTLTLIPDVLWSDGEPLTAEDVVFTIDWVKNPDNNSVNFSSYETIESAEVVDDLTVRVVFKKPNPFWFDPFAGTTTGFVYPKHILESGPEAHDQFIINPVGTGPYVVDSFSPNDQVTYVVNENYREPNKPFFDRVLLKGGGDAAAAARASIQTGEYHYAWNLQIEPDVLAGMESEDAPGEVLFVENVSVTVERINFNFSDPWTEVNGERSQKDTPHPFLTDDAVRRAIVLGVNREQMVKSFYGQEQEVATNIVYGDEAVVSKNTVYEYDPDKAVQVLEEAGWTLAEGSNVRSKDGVELRLVFATSVNSVRQKIQSVVKSDLEKIGFAVQIEQIDAAIYFDASEGTEQNIYHFYWDMNLFQSLPNNPRSMSYMENWYAGPNGESIAQASNGWNGGNASRWSNADYDAAYEAALDEVDPDRLTELFVEMNDLVINNDVTLPIVLVSPRRGISKQLNKTNIARAAFSYDYWNIANWNFYPE